MRNSLNTEACLEPSGDAAAIKHCPAFLALSLIANKWSIRILEELLNAEHYTLRFNQIQKALDNITQRELTKQLREFEKSGLLERNVFPVVPLRVEYTLTPMGCSLWEPVQKLAEWSAQNAQAILEKRNAFDDKKSGL